MSRLLERIARRRRATAGSRLGPRSQHVNGWEPAPPVTGPAPPAAEVEAEVEPEPPLEPELHERTVATWAEDEDVWVEPATEDRRLPQPDQEPEPELDAEPELESVAEPKAGAEPEPEPPAVRPARGEPPRTPGGVATFRLGGRGEMRRRVSHLRRLREVQLRDLGGFVLELHRLGRDRPELVAAKLRAAAVTDEELRTLERALDGQASLREIREAGIGGACAECGAVYGSADRFCASCGTALTAEPDAARLDEPLR